MLTTLLAWVRISKQEPPPNHPRAPWEQESKVSHKRHVLNSIFIMILLMVIIGRIIAYSPMVDDRSKSGAYGKDNDIPLILSSYNREFTYCRPISPAMRLIIPNWVQHFHIFRASFLLAGGKNIKESTRPRNYVTQTTWDADTESTMTREWLCISKRAKIQLGGNFNSVVCSPVTSPRGIQYWRGIYIAFCLSYYTLRYR